MTSENYHFKLNTNSFAKKVVKKNLYLMWAVFCLLASAVQEERQRGKDGKEEVESTSSANSEMPVEKIVEAELSVETKTEQYIDSQVYCFVL